MPAEELGGPPQDRTWESEVSAACSWRVASPEPAPLAGPAARNRYVDLVRLVAIIVVVVGHWLDTTIVVGRGGPAGESALAVVGYVRWFTLLFQVMPLFFLTGGYAAAASWPSWRARGGRWPGWARGRLVRLLRPTSWFIAIMAAAAAVALALGVDPSVVAQSAWAVALQLWFLPVYLVLLMAAVPLFGAWNRAAWLVLAAGVVMIGALDLVVRSGQVTFVGWLNYPLVWGAGFVLGIAWRAGELASRAVPLSLLIGGLLALVGLVTMFDYPPWMIGVPGERISNTSPPSLALLAYGAAQAGLVLLFESPLRRWLDRPRAWAAVVWGNSVVMTVYLWHMVPVVVLAFVLDAAGLLPGPSAGTLAWWGQRFVWVGVLAMLLLAVVRLVGRFERPRPPLMAVAGLAASVLLVACTTLTGYALFRLAVNGFAPGGQLAFGALAVYAMGILALWLAGRPAATAVPDT